MTRPQLHKRLTEGLEMPLTLVSAPGGYGKSTLISSWAMTCDLPYCWISLEESENSFPIFLEYLIHGLKKVLPGIFKETEKLLQLSELPPLATVVTSFTNELIDNNQPCIVILDDYHEIINQEVHDFLMKLFQFPVPGFHIIILTRSDPPFPVSRWRTQSIINEIRRRDLEFTKDDMISLLDKKAIGHNPPDTIDKLMEVSEGWIAGLRSFLYGVSNENDLKLRLDQENNELTGLFHYGMQELLSLRPEFEEYLLNASLLNRFCSEELVYMSRVKLDSVLNDKVAEYLQNLVKKNLFVIPLDAEYRWFRFHHLFREYLHSYLKRKSPKEKLNSLHVRAGEWLSARGYASEAIRCFILGGEIEEAIRLFDHFRWKLLKELNWIQLNELFSLFPNKIIKSSISLRLAESWILIYQGRPFEMFGMLPQISEDIQMLDEGEVKARFLAEINSLLPYQYYSNNEHKKCIETSQQAIDSLQSDQQYARGYAYIFLLGSLQATGRYEEALTLFKEVVEGDPQNILNSHLYLVVCYLHWMECNADDLVNMANELIQVGKVQDNNEALANGLHFKGLGYYAKGDLENAMINFKRAYELRYFTIGVLSVMNSIALVYTLLRQGEIQEAENIYSDLKNEVSRKPGNVFEKMVEILRLELLIAKDSRKDVENYLAHLNNPPITNQSNFYIPRQTLINAYLYLSDNKSLRKAEELIAELEEFLKDKYFKAASFRVEMLKAILSNKKGENGSALLDQIISQCRPKNLLYVFFEGGKELKPLLEKLHTNGDHFIASAIEMCERSISETETLSKREEEILSYMDLPNKEISEKLFISEKTVKSHIHNIFRKLKVTSRIDALKARER